MMTKEIPRWVMFLALGVLLIVAVLVVPEIYGRRVAAGFQAEMSKGLTDEEKAAIREKMAREREEWDRKWDEAVEAAR